MQHKSPLYNWKLRILIAIIFGLIFKFSVDILFGLIYRNSDIFKSWYTYIGVLLLTLGVLQLFYFVSIQLDKKIGWNVYPKKRFSVQLLLHSLVVLFAFGPVRWATELIISPYYFAVIMDEVIILLTTLFITLLYNLFELGLFLLYKWRLSLAEIERFKKENAEFQFEMLRNQVSPHFLFNSLNTLSSLMYGNLDLAADYIRKLSQVYRYVLENRQKELIPLSEEINFINSYKYLFELRFQHRLSIEINIDENCNDKLIVPMTVQMLVENAVKHNVISQKYPLRIEIVAKANQLSVMNSLRKKNPEGYSSGMGLINIQSRYGFVSDKKVQIIETKDKFEVIVPLIQNQ